MATKSAYIAVNTGKEPQQPKRLNLGHAEELELELESRITRIDNYDWMTTCPAPIPIALLVDYLLGTFEHKRSRDPTAGQPNTPSFKEANDRYHSIFPVGSCLFRFPVKKSPSPEYASVMGQTICHIDWRLSHPEVKLGCFKCKSHNSLEHERTNLKKIGSSSHFGTMMGLQLGVM